MIWFNSLEDLPKPAQSSRSKADVKLNQLAKIAVKRHGHSYNKIEVEYTYICRAHGAYKRKEIRELPACHFSDEERLDLVKVIDSIKNSHLYRRGTNKCVEHKALLHLIKQLSQFEKTTGWDVSVG